MFGTEIDAMREALELALDNAREILRQADEDRPEIDLDLLVLPDIEPPVPETTGGMTPLFATKWGWPQATRVLKKSRDEYRDVTKRLLW